MNNQEFKREIKISPAWDKRTDSPETNIGMHCCDLNMLLHCDEAVIEFKIFTIWHLDNSFNRPPWAACIIIHSRKQLPGSNYNKDCLYLKGNCYYRDLAYYIAEELLKTLLSFGIEAVWDKLEDHYNRIFDVR